ATTGKKIEKRKAIGIMVRDTSNLLANELDRLIAERYLAKPTAAAMLHAYKDARLEKRSPAEITNLLNKRPRNAAVVKLPSKIGRHNLYVLKAFADPYLQNSQTALFDGMATENTDIASKPCTRKQRSEERRVGTQNTSLT